MRLVKLDAIESTNDYLKALCIEEAVENFTIVTARNQTKGKGQMGSSWISEPGKNLIMSILIKDLLSDLNNLYHLNVALSVAVINVLQHYEIPLLSIKWPNDIMSGNKKIGGILIENSIKSDASIISIVGLGLNVNQLDFANLPKASSLSLIANTIFDIQKMVGEIAESIITNVSKPLFASEELWTAYTDQLFKKGIPMPFEDAVKKTFMGIIQGVGSDGKLRVLLEDESVAAFNIKEIQMLY